jgi:hypothetical protein
MKLSRVYEYVTNLKPGDKIKLNEDLSNNLSSNVGWTKNKDYTFVRLSNCTKTQPQSISIVIKQPPGHAEVKQQEKVIPAHMTHQLIEYDDYQLTMKGYQMALKDKEFLSKVLENNPEIYMAYYKEEME